MSDRQPPNSGSSNSFLAFIVGGLLVAVVVLGWLFFSSSEDSNDLNISIEGGGDAVDAIDNAVDGE
ncbi:hypothetical protein DC366_04100 [Pelagivirga sediminicola]|uniref:Uncharacterized protein n=1 Tax=Pelagivirga sediminicola TaxID=2170575 RepID=A0A2T7G999_9RHOB|nr:hypothetical protein [Pelagivirga sediminicola]PVA10976.1 hypothetical protein DC366_04100 [Pelagivirga sediminicola]